MRKLKKIVHDRVPPTLRRVKLSSNHPKKPPVVTASVLNDLFNKCSAIKDITLENCDLTTVLVYRARLISLAQEVGGRPHPQLPEQEKMV